MKTLFSLAAPAALAVTAGPAAAQYPAPQSRPGRRAGYGPGHAGRRLQHVRGGFSHGGFFSGSFGCGKLFGGGFGLFTNHGHPFGEEKGGGASPGCSPGSTAAARSSRSTRGAGTPGSSCSRRTRSSAARATTSCGTSGNRDKTEAA